MQVQMDYGVPPVGESAEIGGSRDGSELAVKATKRLGQCGEFPRRAKKHVHHRRADEALEEQLRPLGTNPMDGGSGKSGSADVLHQFRFTLERVTPTTSAHNYPWPRFEDVRVTS